MTVAINTERKAVELKWDTGDPAPEMVKIFATGEAGDLHNTDEFRNDGLRPVSYPADFSGSSKIEVRDLDGNVLDSGTIAV